MTAEALVDTLREAGIALSVSGDKLRVEAPPGTYGPELRARLVEHKEAVRPLVAMRDRLLALARSIELPDRHVNALPASELRACIDQLALWDTDDLRTRVLAFYLRAIAGLEPVAMDPAAAGMREAEA